MLCKPTGPIKEEKKTLREGRAKGFNKNHVFVASTKDMKSCKVLSEIQRIH